MQSTGQAGQVARGPERVFRPVLSLMYKTAYPRGGTIYSFLPSYSLLSFSTRNTHLKTNTYTLDAFGNTQPETVGCIWEPFRRGFIL
jgi:hypothetical protein